MSNTLTNKGLNDVLTLLQNIEAIETPPKITILMALMDSIAMKRKLLRVTGRYACDEVNKYHIAELTSLRHLQRSWIFLTCKFK